MEPAHRSTLERIRALLEESQPDLRWQVELGCRSMQGERLVLIRSESSEGNQAFLGCQPLYRMSEFLAGAQTAPSALAAWLSERVRRPHHQSLR